MTNNNEQRYVIEGLTVGQSANHQIADAIASKSASMLDQALEENFETILEAKLNQAVQETLNIHAQRTKNYAKKFLVTSKNRLAQNLVETQHNHRLASLQDNLDLAEIEDFDTDLLPEVSRIGDEAGAIAIETNADSSVGF